MKLFAVVPSLALAGCMPPSSVKGDDRHRLFDRDGVDLIATSSATRMVLFKKIASNERFCQSAEPTYLSPPLKV